MSTRCLHTLPRFTTRAAGAGGAGGPSARAALARTVASSVTTYRYENGRRYHAYKDGAYYQPNDDKQASAGTIEHHLWLLTLRDALFLAPLENPQRVLDVGTGTGLWAVDMADRYPAVEVIGTDLSPTQVPFAPPNVRFEIDDCCSEWTYPANSFDLIHVRGLVGSVANWPAFYAECMRHLQPGLGYLEQLEFDVRFESEPDDEADKALFDRLGDLFVEAGVRMEKSFKIAENMRARIEEAGFVDVVERRFMWPIGTWHADERLKEIGHWNMRNWENGMEGWILALLTRTLGWSYDDVQLYEARLLKALRERNVRVRHYV
ncbi:uncharacterized protein K452DRAFT_328879 [Aplosporella prunicola CBS 121167]|uniref:Methyltransferase domain-containing protein n=1 Tax=Aplosporella prunicola CBS 121167 TaxID=1176127 RepID=A0A6A6B400_9PEZI|nr:uncharacterized protein K452DRAFT_328879 [Aplosporella prunicola CBS 121167]KAF2138338.1 hypothetical protein K452DRAFT_328879 [Aplosporella prunicola CBS 121167]